MKAYFREENSDCIIKRYYIYTHTHTYTKIHNVLVISLSLASEKIQVKLA